MIRFIFFLFLMVPTMCIADCPDFKTCAAISDDKERLACFDALAAEPKESLPVLPADEYANKAVNLSGDPIAKIALVEGVLSIALLNEGRVTDELFNGVMARLCLPLALKEATWTADKTHVLNKHGRQGYTIEGGGDICLKVLEAEEGGLIFKQALSLHTVTFNPDRND